eukprot:3309924-Amphidinium_carterae.1
MFLTIAASDFQPTFNLILAGRKNQPRKESDMIQSNDSTESSSRHERLDQNCCYLSDCPHNIIHNSLSFCLSLWLVGAEGAHPGLLPTLLQ